MMRLFKRKRAADRPEPELTYELWLTSGEVVEVANRSSLVALQRLLGRSDFKALDNVIFERRGDWRRELPDAEAVEIMKAMQVEDRWQADARGAVTR